MNRVNKVIPFLIYFFALTITGQTIAFGQFTFPTSANFADKQYRAFDFWIGEWDVVVKNYNPDFRWKETNYATAKIYPVLDGKAILELWNENDKEDSVGIRGFSLRYYNPDSGMWDLVLNWGRNNFSNTVIHEGEERHRRFVFRNEFSTSDSTTRKIKFSFSDITANSLRWDDEYSTDGGKSWTKNWIMEFSRKKQFPEWFNTPNSHTYGAGLACTNDSFEMLEKWAGNWVGEIELMIGNNKTVLPIYMQGYNINDGCAVMTFMEYGNGPQVYKQFNMNTFSTPAQKFESGFINNREGVSYQRMYSDMNSEGFEFIEPQDQNNDIRYKTVWKFEDSKAFYEVYFEKEGNWELLKKAEFLKKI